MGRSSSVAMPEPEPFVPPPAAAPRTVSEQEEVAEAAGRTRRRQAALLSRATAVTSRPRYGNRGPQQGGYSSTLGG